jgi:hypothetical protein
VTIGGDTAVKGVGNEEHRGCWCYGPRWPVFSDEL